MEFDVWCDVLVAKNCLVKVNIAIQLIAVHEGLARYYTFEQYRTKCLVYAKRIALEVICSVDSVSTWAATHPQSRARL